MVPILANLHRLAVDIESHSGLNTRVLSTTSLRANVMGATVVGCLTRFSVVRVFVVQVLLVLHFHLDIDVFILFVLLVVFVVFKLSLLVSAELVLGLLLGCL